MSYFRPEPSYTHGDTPKIGIIISNLGTPESPTPRALRRYLGQYLMDRRVVEIPRFITMPITNNSDKAPRNKQYKSELQKITSAARVAVNLGLDVHAGHGLTYRSVFKISKIRNISEFNIGHFLISESLFLGLSNTIKRLKKVINT